MPPMDPNAMQPGPTPGAPEAEMGDGSTEVCIKIAPDGSLSVYAEGGENEGGEQTAQPAADVGAALKIALDLIRKAQAAAGAGAAPDAQFEAGFAGGQPQSRMGR